VFTLGRHRTNDIQLNDLVASKFHARITWQNVYWQNFFWLQVALLHL
jgi:pSer/pThr/pTyr-binding forkhead associated (FHA) protein